jgi:hypothetical protein
MLTHEELYMRDRRERQPNDVPHFIKALEILRTLMSNPDQEFFIQGEHDEIYVFAGPPTSDEQQIELYSLGFMYDEDCGSWRVYT